jgi:hypothetical protein
MVKAIRVASRKGLFTFRRRGGEWKAGTPDFLGQPVTAVLDDTRDGQLYAALNLGHFGIKLHRSSDQGKTWTEVATPAFPPQEGDAATKPAVDQILTLVPGGWPGTLWAGTLPGGLFKSEDRGQTWSLVDSLWNMPEREKWMGGGYDKPVIHSVLVDPRHADHLLVGVSTGGVWKSEDGGKSWRLVGKGLRAEYMPPAQAYDLLSQDVHRLSHCAANPDVVWCQHHNGIFRSTDRGETFKELKSKPSVFGFAVAAHPDDPKVAWFVPAVKDECRVPVGGKLVVNRARDGGKRFETFGNGLPSKGSYDLIYRHALDVDDSGKVLAMGSTTGNLWASVNGGKKWEHVSGHLPPIAQVKID